MMKFMTLFDLVLNYTIIKHFDLIFVFPINFEYTRRIYDIISLNDILS